MIVMSYPIHASEPTDQYLDLTKSTLSLLHLGSPI
jgi:hypothetical protein